MNTWKTIRNVIIYIIGGLFTIILMGLLSIVMTAAVVVRIVNAAVTNEDAFVCFEDVYEQLNHLFDYYR